MKKFYVLLKDQTVYETTYVCFEGGNVCFSAEDNEHKIRSFKINYTLIEDIRATL